MAAMVSVEVAAAHNEAQKNMDRLGQILKGGPDGSLGLLYDRAEASFAEFAAKVGIPPRNSRG